MLATSLRTRNAGTVLGHVWWLLDPLLLVGVYYVLVAVILRRGTGEHYAIFLATSILVWKFFASGVRQGVTTTASKERQTRHVRFPKIILPFVAVIAESSHFVVALVILVLASMAKGIFPHYVLAFLIVVVLVQLMFALAVAFMLAALNVFFRDVQHVMGYVFRAWFFLSPGLYPLSAVPEKYRSIYEINPFATILPAYHSAIIDHEIFNPARLGVVAGVGAGLLVISYLFFVRLERSFAKVN